jgi:glycosyltransferase involved in cell wall biosynthesis
VRKRICFVQLKALAYFLPELAITPGGAERQIYLISRELAKNQGNEVVICVGDFGQEKMLSKEGVSLFCSITSSRNRVLQLPLLYRCLKKIDADVYVFRTVDLGVAVGVLLVKLLGKKIIYMVANADEANPKALKSWFGSFRSAAMAWVYRNADALVVQTDEQAQDFKQFRGLDVQCKMPNLFTAPSFKEDEFLPRQFVLWVGRSDPLKRPHLFIEMAKRFPEVSFVLVSPATSYVEYSREIECRSEEVSNLTLLDRQTEEELMKWYCQAMVLINTSVSEGFSNAMLEALYWQVPMLTRGVNPDGVLEKYELGFAREIEAEFDACFEQLIQNESMRENMGKRGRAYVEKEHCPKTAMDKLEGVIETLC